MNVIIFELDKFLERYNIVNNNMPEYTLTCMCTYTHSSQIKP